MNLYRLDDTKGNRVCDLLGPSLDHRWTTARARAIHHAQETGTSVEVTRISGGGNCRMIAFVRPSGKVTRL